MAARRTPNRKDTTLMTTTTITAGCAEDIEQARGRYAAALAALASEAVRAERASVLTVMAEAAGSLAALTRGVTAEGDMENGDYLAWLDARALLAQLAHAEMGYPADTGSNYDGPTDFQEWGLWDDVAEALEAAERAEAVNALAAWLTAPNGKGEQRTRQFAYDRWLEAAEACTARYPEHVTTQQEYLLAHAAVR